MFKRTQPVKKHIGIPNFYFYRMFYMEFIPAKPSLKPPTLSRHLKFIQMFFFSKTLSCVFSSNEHTNCEVIRKRQRIEKSCFMQIFFCWRFFLFHSSSLKIVHLSHFTNRHDIYLYVMHSIKYFLICCWPNAYKRRWKKGEKKAFCLPAAFDDCFTYLAEIKNNLKTIYIRICVLCMCMRM